MRVFPFHPIEFARETSADQPAGGESTAAAGKGDEIDSREAVSDPAGCGPEELADVHEVCQPPCSILLREKPAGEVLVNGYGAVEHRDAFRGEAGYQGRLLMPGLRFKLWPIFGVRKFPWVQVPAGEIGVVIAQVGAPLPIGAKSAVYRTEFANFSGLTSFIPDPHVIFSKSICRPLKSALSKVANASGSTTIRARRASSKSTPTPRMWPTSKAPSGPLTWRASI